MRKLTEIDISSSLHAIDQWAMYSSDSKAPSIIALMNYELERTDSKSWEDYVGVAYNDATILYSKLVKEVPRSALTFKYERRNDNKLIVVKENIQINEGKVTISANSIVTLAD